MAQYFASGNGNIKYYRTFANRKYTDRFMKQIILITGGARSGKSSYAERLALSLSPNPVYLATSRIWDEEFRQRVLRHQANRGPEWTNYIPARLTALLMILVSGRFSLLRFVGKYGSRHASPNSGYPEAALAGILNCRFGGPHYYFGEEVWKPFIGNNERALTTEDMKKAVCVNRQAEVLMVVLVWLTILLSLS